MTTEETLKHVLDALRSTEALLRAVIKDKEFSREKLTAVEVKLENVEKELNSLLYLIRGNGTEGIQIRTHLLEGKFKVLEESLNKRYEEVLRLKTENTRGRWGMYAAIATGGLGFLTAIITAVLKYAS